jgi:hypothetical protein
MLSWGRFLAPSARETMPMSWPSITGSRRVVEVQVDRVRATPCCVRGEYTDPRSDVARADGHHARHEWMNAGERRLALASGCLLHDSATNAAHREKKSLMAPIDPHCGTPAGGYGRPQRRLWGAEVMEHALERAPVLAVHTVARRTQLQHVARVSGPGLVGSVAPRGTAEEIMAS